MKPTRGTHHKKKKWRCPQCGRHRMQSVTDKRKKAQRRIRRTGDE
ncbi:MAG: hypothetical protein VX265_06725 [Myxococcota bacterium]|nr:hypothetical protein [Myxococcota bacterium]